jgi:hypothetical protein
VLLLFLSRTQTLRILRARASRLGVIVTTPQEKTLDTIFPVKITEQNLSTVDEEAKDVKRAFLYYFLIKTLADHDKDNQKHVRVAMHLLPCPFTLALTPSCTVVCARARAAEPVARGMQRCVGPAQGHGFDRDREGQQTRADLFPAAPYLQAALAHVQEEPAPQRQQVPPPFCACVACVACVLTH